MAKVRQTPSRFEPLEDAHWRAVELAAELVRVAVDLGATTSDSPRAKRLRQARENANTVANTLNEILEDLKGEMRK